MRKLVVIYACGFGLALVAGLLGVLFSAVGTERGSRKAKLEEAWSLGPIAVRGEEEYRRAADGFRARYRWLVPEEPKPDEAALDAAAQVAEAPPPPPVWRFVGVLLEGEEADRFALVAEAGAVNRYKVGEAFKDGTRLLAVEEQSVRVASNGQERDIHLYRP